MRTRLEKAASSLFPQYDIDVAYLYGSYAQGEQSPESDIDIAVHFKDHSLKKLLEVGRRLQAQIETERELDVRSLDKGTPRFRFRIIQEGKVIYEVDKAKRADLEEKIDHEYHDHQSLVETRQRRRKKRVI